MLQVDQWLEFAPHLVTGGGLEPACATVNEALALRTYLVGYSLSSADIAIWGQLHGTLVAPTEQLRYFICTRFQPLVPASSATQ